MKNVSPNGKGNNGRAGEKKNPQRSIVLFGNILINGRGSLRRKWGIVRTITLDRITEEVRRLCEHASYYLDDSMVQGFKTALRTEDSPLGREILVQLIDNAATARREQTPLCQDTGVAVIFVELGEDVRFDRPGFIDAIRRGVASGYRDSFLRGSMVADPLVNRKNTSDNTPPMIHIDIVTGEALSIRMMAKGSGCENMSAVKMLTPADGVDGVRKFVVQSVKEAGGNPCPPLIIGVGIGGNFEYCTILSKKALLRPLDSVHKDPFYARLEHETLDEINKTGVGPMGIGGRTTAIAVYIETAPCHIASLPVAVNIDCHSHRVKEVAL